MTDAPRRVRPVIAAVLGVALLALAIWILIPGPTYFMLTFSVGGPEVSLFYMMAAVFIIAIVAVLITEVGGEIRRKRLGITQ